MSPGAFATRAILDAPLEAHQHGALSRHQSVRRAVQELRDGSPNWND